MSPGRHALYLDSLSILSGISTSVLNESDAVCIYTNRAKYTQHV